jgi:glycine cleavage system H protein
VADYDIPDDVRYTKEDEWARVQGNRVTVGITDYAQQQLGDIVFVELPEVGKTIEAGDPFGHIESVKAVSDLYAPVAGRIVEVNEDLKEQPESVNEDCYGDGWMVVIEASDAADLDELLDPKTYAQHVRDRAE